MSNIAIEIVPVTEDNYYKTIVYQLEYHGSGKQLKMVRDIYHTDNLSLAIDLLHQLNQHGALLD
jgi:hypothetical protein